MCGVKVAVEPEEGLVHSSVPIFSLTSHVVRGHQLSCKPDLVPWGRQNLVQVFTLAGGRWSRNKWVDLLKLLWICTQLPHKNVTWKVILLKDCHRIMSSSANFFILLWPWVASLELINTCALPYYIPYILLYTLFYTLLPGISDFGASEGKGLTECCFTFFTT